MNVTEAIQTDWASEPGVGEACLHVLQALATAEHKLEHYSFSDMRRFAAVEDDSVVARAVTYLSNPRVRVLRTCLMYEHRGFFFELPKEELQHYAKDEEVIHPESGQPISKSEVLVFFVPGPGLEEQGAR